MRFRFALALGCVLAFSTTATAFAAGGVDITDATEAQKKESLEHYQMGTQSFERKKYDVAYTEFSKSYDVVRSPNAHMMMARSLLELGQAARAYNELGLVEDEAQGQEKYKTTIEKSHALRVEAAKSIAIVTIKIVGDTSGPLQITLDDLIAPIHRPYGVSPGKAVARAFRAGKLRDSEELVLGAGETKTIELDLGPADAVPAPVVVAPPKPAPRKASSEPVDSSVGNGLVVSGAILTAVGLSGFAVGGAFYKLSSDDYAALVEKCGGDPAKTSTFSCTGQSGIRDLQSSGKDKQTVAVAALIAGGATTALGLGLLMGGAIVNHNASKSAETAHVDVRIAPGGVWVSGTF